jgi:2-polyprenyl-3-methyl-5-hydroxy-6-metoxy-1,4-benzoquinol methylase
MSRPHSSAELAAAYWDQRTATTDADAELAAFGTVSDGAAVGLRDRLERAHLDRVLALEPGHRVLDLGGGAGRIALWVAPRVAEVTLVDVSERSLAVAEARAQHAGLGNVRTVRGSLLDVEPVGLYDRVLVIAVACYLDDDELERFAARASRMLAPGGRLVLKEPVTTDGQRREDVRRDAAGQVTYRATFRPRQAYAEVFGRHLRKTYQQPTLAHLIPWFAGGTDGAAEALSSPAGALATRLLAPVLERVDPQLQVVEQALRGHPLAKRLLAPAPVVQDLYVFERPPAPVAGDSLLSVVVIAYNEEECIAPVTDELIGTLDAARVPHEIVLVDDGSKDGTLAHMRRLAERDARVRVITYAPNRGIGGALRAGFDAARGDHVTWIPADGQIAPETVVELYRRRAEAPMLTTIYRQRQDPWYRTVISQSLNLIIRARTGQVAKSGGNYLFARDAWRDHGPTADDTMMLSTAFRGRLREAGQRIVEVPIDCRPRQAGSSKVLNPRTILTTLGQTLRMGRVKPR